MQRAVLLVDGADEEPGIDTELRFLRVTGECADRLRRDFERAVVFATLEVGACDGEDLLGIECSTAAAEHLALQLAALGTPSTLGIQLDQLVGGFAGGLGIASGDVGLGQRRQSSET